MTSDEMNDYQIIKKIIYLDFRLIFEQRKSFTRLHKKCGQKSKDRKNITILRVLRAKYIIHKG